MSELPKVSLAEQLAERILALGVAPPGVREKCQDLAVDVIGLCVTARQQDYVQAALAGCDDDGPCTAIGQARTLSAASAAFINGTAAHGEDCADTPSALCRSHAASTAGTITAPACRRSAALRSVSKCFAG